MKGIKARNEEKLSLFDEFMKGDHIMVHIDAKNQSVKVPESLKDNPSLTLKLSYHFQGEITRDEKGIYAYLKFDGNYSECILPWDKIWGITASDGQNKVWPEDMPKELLVSMAKQQLRNITQKIFGKKPAKKTLDEEQIPENKEKKKKPHLKLIK
jgi:stringent starvation protein B